MKRVVEIVRMSSVRTRLGRFGSDSVELIAMWCGKLQSLEVRGTTSDVVMGNWQSAMTAGRVLPCSLPTGEPKSASHLAWLDHGGTDH